MDPTTVWSSCIFVRKSLAGLSIELGHILCLRRCYPLPEQPVSRYGLELHWLQLSVARKPNSRSTVSQVKVIEQRQREENAINPPLNLKLCMEILALSTTLVPFRPPSSLLLLLFNLHASHIMLHPASNPGYSHNSRHRSCHKARGVSLSSVSQ